MMRKRRLHEEQMRNRPGGNLLPYNVTGSEWRQAALEHNSRRSEVPAVVRTETRVDMDLPSYSESRHCSVATAVSLSCKSAHLIPIRADAPGIKVPEAIYNPASNAGHQTTAPELDYIAPPNTTALPPSYDETSSRPKETV